MRPPRGLFLQVPDWLFFHDRVRPSGTIIRVYLALLAEGNRSSRITSADRNEVMATTGLSRSCVYRDVATLREIGAVAERSDGTYFLPMDDPAEKALASTTVDELHARQSMLVDTKSTTVDDPSTRKDPQSTTVDRSFYREGSETESPPHSEEELRQASAALAVAQARIRDGRREAIRDTDAWMAEHVRRLRAGTAPPEDPTGRSQRAQLALLAEHDADGPRRRAEQAQGQLDMADGGRAQLRDLTAGLRAKGRR